MPVHPIIKITGFIFITLVCADLNAQTDTTVKSAAADSLQLPVEENVESMSDTIAETQSYGNGFHIPEHWGIGLRMVNIQSSFTIPKKKLEFFIQHRFGYLSGGRDNFFGLDESNIRLGFDYGLVNNVTVGISRSNMGKMFNGYMKWRIVSQGNMSPVTAAWYSDMSVSAARPPTGLDPYYFSHRFRYVHQLIVSRVFGEQRLLLQVSPALVHRNLTDSISEPNDLALVTAAMRLRITNRLSLTGEYNYIFNHDMRRQLDASAGAGLEIYTGGHVFQLVLTNVSSMNESQFLTTDNGRISKGELRLGFNIVRRF